MKPLYLLLLTILAAIITSFLFSSAVFANSSNGEIFIHINEQGFEPETVEIEQGSAVIFENAGLEGHWPASDTHPTHELYKGFDSKKPILPGGSWSFAFTEPGIWTMHDHLYPQFSGKIAVKSANNQAAAKIENNGNKNIFLILLDSLKVLLNKITSKENKGQKIQIESNRIIGSATAADSKTIRADFDFRNITQSPLDIGTVTYNTKINVHAYKFIKPEPYDINEIYQNDINCISTDFFCFSTSLKNITAIYGPQAAIGALEKIQKDGKISSAVDEHQLAHEIGRQTARSFGLNAQSFLLCPMSSFNGGCQHGFFEYVLGKTGTTTEAAELICESLNDSFSSKFKFYCYHGIGHGLMMAQSYDLNASLSVCDSFNSSFASDGCWQGVFMENVNVGMRNKAREGVFSDKDPLAPCNLVEEKYRHECFINHAGYLMVFFNKEIEKAASACLKAPKKSVSSCFQSLGLLTTNPSWQHSITGQAGIKKNIETALELCNRFPDEGKNDCFMSALDNIMNYDEMNLSNLALPFCEKADSWPKELCYRQIGINIMRQVAEVPHRREICAQVPIMYNTDCLKGALI